MPRNPFSPTPFNTRLVIGHFYVLRQFYVLLTKQFPRIILEDEMIVFECFDTHKDSLCAEKNLGFFWSIDVNSNYGFGKDFPT